MRIAAFVRRVALVLVPTAAERLHIDRLVVHALHGGLVVERVDVTRPAVHETENDVLGLGREMRRQHGGGGLLPHQQRHEIQ